MIPRVFYFLSGGNLLTCLKLNENDQKFSRDLHEQVLFQPVVDPSKQFKQMLLQNFNVGIYPFNEQN